MCYLLLAPIFFCCHYITRVIYITKVVVYNHSPEVSYLLYNQRQIWWLVDEIGVSMKSFPGHENQHIAATWWTVNHVASNQCGVGEGGRWLFTLCYSCCFCFPCNIRLYLYQLISMGILYILFVWLLFCVSPYIYCKVEMNKLWDNQSANLQ